MEKQTYYSQYEQDRTIDYLLAGKKNGYFIDIGAHDGISLSNTYFFERYRDWTGLCFEPIEDVYRQLTANRRCECINGAVADKAEPLTFLRCTGYAEMLSGIAKFREEKHMERTHHDIAVHGGEITEITVQGYNLNDVLRERAITAVDFISLDIEGGEYEVLQTIDFDQVDVKILTIELNFPETEQRIQSLLEGKGFFLLIRQGADGLFLNRKHFSFRQPRVIGLFASNQLQSLVNRVAFRLRRLISSK